MSLSGKAYSSAVTVTSLDPANPVNIDIVRLSSVSNLSFKSVAIGKGFPNLTLAEVSTIKMAKVSASSNITFDSVYFHGSLDGNPNNDGGGIDVCQGSKNITIVNSEFEQLYRAGTFGGTDGITLIGNKVHDIRSDGFDFVRVSNVLIDSNSFTNFSVISGDHPDAIHNDPDN